MEKKKVGERYVENSVVEGKNFLWQHKLESYSQV
jgi:hypothetical protein